MEIIAYIAALVLLATLGWHLVGLVMERQIPPMPNPAPRANGTNPDAIARPYLSSARGPDGDSLQANGQ